MPNTVPSPTSVAVKLRRGRAVCHELWATHLPASRTDAIGPGTASPMRLAGSRTAMLPLSYSQVSPSSSTLTRLNWFRQARGDSVMARDTRIEVRADPYPSLSAHFLDLIGYFCAVFPDYKGTGRS